VSNSETSNRLPISYGRQHITSEDIEAVSKALQSDYLTQGPRIVEFEKAFAEYIGCRYAVAVSNGTAALHLAAMALDVKKGEKVITTPITFAASANCVRYCEGEVLFADIDPKNYCIDLNRVEDLLKKEKAVKGIIPVDFAGYPVHLEELRELANKFGCWIIEDACHAPGAWFTDSNGREQKCGNGAFADIGIFSFHPVKHIATGEGGMITTNNTQIFEALTMLRSHGITRNPALLEENHGGWYYEMQDLGYNYRITDFQCALGSSQLKRADDGLHRRNKIAQAYNNAFANSGIIRPFVADDVFHAYHLYIIQVNDRLGLYNYLRSKNIFAQVHYIPVHLMPYYKQFGWSKGDCPVAESYYEKCLSLPMYPSLTDEEQAYVIETIKQYLQIS
jgi:UDP-4-amino-4,6-dideoxy-N-acetyl-beta-L-altrosamine transaminase